jgi:hypothetical protein
MVPPLQKEVFERKAHWFRTLARLAEKNEAARQTAKSPARAGLSLSAGGNLGNFPDASRETVRAPDSSLLP